MPRQKIPDIAPRTIRVHIPTYESILRFFSLSSSGVRGSDAIRQLIKHFGVYCEEQMRMGRMASAKDLQAAEDMVKKVMEESDVPS